MASDKDLPALRGVSVYRLHADLARAIDNNLTDLLRPDTQVAVHRGRIPGTGHRLILITAEPRQWVPSWRTLLQPAFETLPTAFGAVTPAVLLIRPPESPTPTFAIPFGTAGRGLLRPNSTERRFGLKVALNAICTPDAENRKADPDRIRAVEAKRPGGNTLRTRRQAAHRATFETFGLDTIRDIVRTVTGAPTTDRWGSLITGSDAVRITIPVTLGELGTTCDNLEEEHAQTHYRERFGWIDNVREITDRKLIQQLDFALLNQIRSPAASPTGASTLELVPPAILDWEEIVDYRLRSRRKAPLDNLSLSAYAEAANKASEHGLTIPALKRQEVIVRFDDEREERWPIYDCLTGEVQLGGSSYVIDEGQYYEIDGQFMHDLNAAIDGIPIWNRSLPLATPDTSDEDRYNKRAAASLGDALCLDKQTVRLPSRTTPIEICDILTAAGEFVHVKPRFKSSDLSHLFGQGTVSADLLVSSSEFRKFAQKRVDTVLAGPGKHLPARTANALRGLFDLRPHDGQITVVYAIIAPWKGRTLSAALPFFSKLNLRAHVAELLRLGYKVAHAKVDTTASLQSTKPRRRAKSTDQQAA